MDFVNRLRPEHLSAFWFFASASNFSLIATFGALLQATSPGREEAEFYASRLREFGWTLNVCARRANWVAEAVGLLDGWAEVLGGMGEKPIVGMQQVPRPVGGKAPVGFSTPLDVEDGMMDEEDASDGEGDGEGDGDGEGEGTDYGVGAVSYTHLTLPTIYSV